MNRLFTNTLLIIALLLTSTFVSCDDKEKDDNDVDIVVTGVSLNQNELFLLVGEYTELIANVSPENAANKNVIWSTSDSSIVMVENGFVTALAEGDAIVTVTTVDSGYTATCDITVRPVSVQGVSINHLWAVLAIDGTVTLTTTTFPENATNQAVEWSTSNSSIVKVDKGVLTAVAEGEATITATTADGGYTAECNVSVTPYSMTMTTDKYVYDATLSMAGTAGFSIDWGDGTVEFHSLSNDYTDQSFSHNYLSSPKPTHTITVAGLGITKLNCNGNQLTTLDVSKNTELTKLSCANNLFTSLDVSSNTSLTELYCSDNQLTNLDISNNKVLATLNCENNQLKTLNLESNTALINLNCSHNQLTTLNVVYSTVTRPGGYSGMDMLDCSFNQLNTLTLAEGSIQDLNCSNNRLTALDMRNVGTNGYFKIYNNLLGASALNDIFNNLHTIALALTGSINIVYIGGNPGADDCNKSIATDKRWEVNTTLQ